MYDKSTLTSAVVVALFHLHSLVFNFNAYLQSPPTSIVILFHVSFMPYYLIKC